MPGSLDAGIAAQFVQDNQAKSAYGVVRGLHYQVGLHAQAKLVQVLEGEVFDVAADLREGSPTFGQWYGVVLSEQNKKQLYIPKGFAHGYSVLSPTAVFFYKCDNYYAKSEEGGIQYDDPGLAIDWGLPESARILSPKDLELPYLETTERNRYVMHRIRPHGGQVGQEIQALQDRYPSWEWVFTDKDELDLSVPGQIRTFFQNLSFDYCIHCAAYTAVDRAESEPELAARINAGAVRELAQACKEQGTFLIHISSDYVYDNSLNRPLQTDPTTPKGVYAKTKLEGDRAALDVHGPSTLILRASWIYSSFGHNFVKTMLRLAAAEREEIRVVCDQIGTPTYAADLAQTILGLIAQPARQKRIPAYTTTLGKGFAVGTISRKRSSGWQTSHAGWFLFPVKRIQPRRPGHFTACWTKPDSKRASEAPCPTGKIAWKTALEKWKSFNPSAC